MTNREATRRKVVETHANIWAMLTRRARLEELTELVVDAVLVGTAIEPALLDELRALRERY